MRDSKWTHIYWDADNNGKLFAYIRLVPDFMDTEAGGFSHGISLGCLRFDTKEEAEKVADCYDKFLDVMAAELLATKEDENV